MSHFRAGSRYPAIGATMSKTETTNVPHAHALAARIGDKIFPNFMDATRREELIELLVKFADEIQRSAIEP